MTSKLLLVEPSATMRYVLENYAQSLGFAVVAIGEYDKAEEALHKQFSTYGDDFAGILLGWSIVPDKGAESLISVLETPEYADLPVVVMSTDMRAETRAWVSGREHTAVLHWKDYQAVDELLRKLLKDPVEDQDTFTSKFDNADINVLIVDDSVSIRFALRDLFELQGYKVSVASGHDDAMIAARRNMFDIAVIDFYLEEGTGDQLCKKLIADPATGNVTCTILTGTYADHIIKRSLRAGAVECMFKNETSELLLARIDALSRFVRQRKRLNQEQRRLDELVDTLAGATMIIGANDTITYASRQAYALLGFEARSNLLGLNATQVVDIAKIRENSGGKHKAQWRDAAQGAVEVVYRHLSLEQSKDVVVNFKVLAKSTESEVASTEPETVRQSATDVVPSLRLHESSTAFVSTLQGYPESLENPSELVSLLMIDTYATVGDDPVRPSHEIAELASEIHTALLDVYKRENHVAQLGSNRYGFLLRHTTEPQAYLLTRKIMQICNSIESGTENLKISCTGCLFSVSKNADKTSAQLLQMTAQGMDVVNQRGMNQALLLDLRRMLPVYAESESK